MSRALGVRLALALSLALAAAWLSGCTPHIGDHCNLNTDCSLQGTRVCDNAQPNGYCTVFNCAPNTCPDNAACVMLYPEVPGCSYDGYSTPSRTQRTMCLAWCTKDSDCRSGEGYECRDPRTGPWDALIIDDNQNKMVCLPRPTVISSTDAGDGEAPVCMPEGPVVTPIDAGAPDSGAPDAQAD